MTPFQAEAKRLAELHAKEPDGEYKAAVSELVRELRADFRLADNLGDACYRLEHFLAIAGIDHDSCELCSGTRVFCGGECGCCEDGS